MTSEDKVGGDLLISLDSSVLFDIPRLRPINVRGGRQLTGRRLPEGEFLLDFYTTMCDMISAGMLVFPEQVVREANNTEEKMQDLAIALTEKGWGLADSLLRRPDESYVRAVLNQSHKFDLTWSDESKADVYVVAIGLTQREVHQRNAVVATNDGNMINYCRDVGMRVLDTLSFVEAVIAWRDGRGSG